MKHWQLCICALSLFAISILNARLTYGQSLGQSKARVSGDTVYPAVGDNLAQDMAAGCPTDTSTTCEVVLPTGAVLSGFTSNTPAKRPNVSIGGTGMGTYASLTNSTGDSILTSSGGSVIQCSMELTTGANNWTLHDLSVDVGDSLVSAGQCTEGNGIDGSPPYSKTQSPAIQDLSINNVSILLRNAKSAYHAFKCENAVNCSASNSYALFGQHGFVGKFGSNFQFTNLWSSGHTDDCAIFKSGTTGYQVFANLTNATMSNITCVPAQSGDTQGILVDAQNGNMSDITLTDLTMQGTLNGVSVETDSESSVTGLTISTLGFVSAPYQNGGNYQHDGVLLEGTLGTITINGLSSSGADHCLGVQTSDTTLSSLSMGSPQCTNTYSMIFDTAGGGNTVIDSPAIVHTAAKSSPTISCKTSSGVVTSTGCTTTAGSGLWYSPKITFYGCKTAPGVTFVLSNNAVVGYSVSEAGAGCPSTISGSVTPNWDSYDFYNRGSGTYVTVDNPTYNGSSTETIGYASGTDGIAPAVVFESGNSKK